MIEVEFAGPSPVIVEAEPGRLLDACDESPDRDRLPELFSCRAATCGTCKVEVLSGDEHLEPPLEAERDHLGDSPRGHRLACQVRLRDGSGKVKLRLVDGPGVRVPRH